MAGTAEQQAIIALQGELGAVRAQVVAVTTAYDALKGAHDALNAASDRLLGERAAEIKATEDSLATLSFVRSSTFLTARISSLTLSRAVEPSALNLGVRSSRHTAT